MFICIGRRKDNHGRIIYCTKTSETPSNSARPEWGWLCEECSGARYGRAPLELSLPDIDKPNALEMDPSELYHGRVNLRVDESEAEEMDKLTELEIM